MRFNIMQGDNKETLKTLADNSVDAIITDPPYGIDFLGKDWDGNTGAIETYQECLRVLKPGGYILAFSAARTYHHLAITLEQAGFEIRDQLMWLYSSGFPKGQDLGKAIQKRMGVTETTERNKLNGYAKEQSSHGAQRVGDVTKDDYENTIKETVCTSPEAQQWSGWKTALKPAHEPICMARKPFKGSCIDNVLNHGVGAINIDASRVPFASDKEAADYYKQRVANTNQPENPNKTCVGSFNRQSGLETKHESTVEDIAKVSGKYPSNVIGEVDGYQKFFYCPKVSRKERHIGFEDPGAMFPGSRFDVYMPTAGKTNPETTIKNVEEKLKNIGNNHPTVKPVALMRYLIKLVTPPNSIVLDPFNGSGSTGMAAVELGHTYIGCELDPAYVEIAKRRIEAWNDTGLPKELFE